MAVTIANKGIEGVSGIYELVRVTTALAGLIHQGASEAQLTREARRLANLFSDGQRRVLRPAAPMNCYASPRKTERA